MTDLDSTRTEGRSPSDDDGDRPTEASVLSEADDTGEAPTLLDVPAVPLGRPLPPPPPPPGSVNPTMPVTAAASSRPRRWVWISALIIVGGALIAWGVIGTVIAVQRTTDRDALSAALDVSQTELRTVRGDLARMTRSRDRAVAKVRSLQGVVDRLEGRVSELDLKVLGLTGERDALDGKVENLSNEKAQTEDERDSLEAEGDTLREVLRTAPEVTAAMSYCVDAQKGVTTAILEFIQLYPYTTDAGVNGAIDNATTQCDAAYSMASDLEIVVQQLA